jgi:hypothetical protein
MKRLSLLVVIPTIFMLAGIFFFAMGVKELVLSQHFAANATAAEGTIVGSVRVVTRRKTGTGNYARYEDVTAYYPVVSFVTSSGEVVQFQANEGSQDRSSLAEGQRVGVLYDPASPREARLGSWSSVWGGAIGGIGSGLFFLVFGGVILMLVRRQARQRPQDPRPSGLPDPFL